MTDEEKEELQELINLLYNGHISQYGKRKLEEYINKLQKENEELQKFKENVTHIRDKMEVEDYYSLTDATEDLSKEIGDYEEEFD